jgi:hypothetical protein
MNMNDRFGRTLALLAILIAAGSTTANGSSTGESRIDFRSTASSSGKSATAQAAEARRLADQAAELAHRAATLAAQSQTPSSTPLEAKQTQLTGQPQSAWNIGDAAEVLISDTDPQPTAAALPSTGWRRRHGAGTDMAIRFSAVAAAGPPAAAAGQTAQANSQPSASSEPKATPPAAAAPVVTQEKPGGTVASQALKDGNVQLVAASYDDPKVTPAQSEEPMPAPAPPYGDGKGPHNHGNCDSCGDVGCCEPRRTLFWASGIEATFLSPDLNSFGTSFEVEEFAEERLDDPTSASDDPDSIYMAPRIWIGVQGCLWGANLRYWHLRASEGSFDPTLGFDGEWDTLGCGIPDLGFNSCNDLEAYTVDLEITRRFCLHDCWMQFSAGVRHAEIEHNESIFGAALTNDSQIFGFGQAHRQSRGTGLVFGWYGRRPIFPCSCVHWFYNVHWSAVWGPTETAAETGVMLSLTTTDPDAVAAAGSVNGASTVVEDTMFIGEIQLGLEWDYALRCLPANAFCRTAIEYQRWSGGTGYSAANSFAGASIDDGVNPVVDTTFAAANAAADAPELDLIGVSFATGLTW